MHALIGNPGKVPGVTEVEAVCRPVKRRGPGEIAQDAIGAKHLFDCTGGVVGLRQILKDGTDCLKGFLRDSCCRFFLKVPPAWTARGRRS